MTQQGEPPRTAQRKRGAEIMLQNLAVGTRLILRNGAELETVENPRVVNGSLCGPRVPARTLSSSPPRYR